MEASLQGNGDTDAITKQGFILQETLDEPFDVTLLVKDGKELKAHRRVLSEASTFFNKLLNSDMRESNEGIVRLEMLSEFGMRDILEFIYTGNVHISAEDNAHDLIAMADFFDIPHLKLLAGNVLMQELNVSNSISAYCLAKRYQCEELIRDTKDFIHSNFTAVAKTEEFLDLSSQDVKMWISSDEINVTAEEDVFEIILTWIDHDRGDRKKHFADLFREVRLVHVSRDFLHGDIVTNDLVNYNEGSMDLVKEAMKVIDSKNYDHPSVLPRRSLETPALVIDFYYVDNRNGHHILCYYPHEQKWSRFQGTQGPVLPRYRPNRTGEVISCHGELFFIYQTERIVYHSKLPFKSWAQLPQPVPWNKELLCHFFVAKNVIYGLFPAVDDSQYSIEDTQYSYHFLLMKYKPDTNSWEQITSLDMGCRRNICIVAKDNFIYFLGGQIPVRRTVTGADRYDLCTNTWDKLADLKEARFFLTGAAAYGKIFIAGLDMETYEWITCEVYDELANEWQLIAPIGKCGCLPTLTCVDNKLFAVREDYISFVQEDDVPFKCFDRDSNSWKGITIPLKLLPQRSNRPIYSKVCSMRVLKSSGGSKSMRKCAIM